MEEIKARYLDILPCSLKEIREFVESHHYSHNVNGVKITQCFKVVFNNLLVGGVIFGAISTTAWKKFVEKESDLLELRRLVLLDEVGRNSESRVVGFTLRWIKKNLQGVKKIVSYADPNYGHSGVIYRASNFKYLGISATDVGYKDKENGKIYHSRALRTKYKGEYKPFVKRLREKKENGLLEEIPLLGKHCYVYELRK